MNFWIIKLKTLKLFLKLRLLKKCTCPFCGITPSRVHSTYQREIQDLHLYDKQTILFVHARKMFCESSDCQATTFAEHYPFVTKN
ncbi:transposase family protein [Clostridium beijerinckii]